MKNSKSTFMKQPELGKKVSELRAAKGLTQEELVEKCNISVRTIQRIESGEVTPRTYTIKTILSALDYDLNAISNKDDSVSDSFTDGVKKFMLIDVDANNSNNFFIKNLNYAWIFGIIYFVLGFIEGAADYYLFTEDRLIFSEENYIFIKLFSLISFVFFMRGFILIGGLFKNYLLKIMSFIMIFTVALLAFYDIFTIHDYSGADKFIAGAASLTFGCIGILYGYSLMKLHGAIGSIAKLAGALQIIGGGFLLTILLAFIGLLIYIPAELLEIIIIFKVIAIIKERE